MSKKQQKQQSKQSFVPSPYQYKQGAEDLIYKVNNIN
jgi:hypothetical protein